MQDLKGKWGLCSIGRVGRIEGRGELPWGLAWIGTGLDGEPWCSRDPRIFDERDCAILDRWTHQE